MTATTFTVLTNLNKIISIILSYFVFDQQLNLVERASTYPLRASAALHTPIAAAVPTVASPPSA